MIPKLMVRKRATIATKRPNWFPMKGGVSKYHSTHVIMHESQFDYEEILQIPFGAYVQVSYKLQPSNKNWAELLAPSIWNL